MSDKLQCEQNGQVWITVVVAIVVAVVVGGAIYFTTRPAAAEELGVSNLKISPQEEISPGADVSTSVDVTNPGGVKNSKTLILKVDGEIEDTKDVEVAPGDTETVSFTVTRQEKTIYDVSVDGMSGRFAVGVPLPSGEVKNPSTYIYETIGEPNTLDPAWCYDSASGEVLYNIYETLIFYKGEKVDEFEPMLATEWEILDNGLTYRFKIREDVVFHNGNSLTPEDVEYSLERVMVMDRSGGPAWMLFEPLLDTHGSRDGDGEIVVDYEDIDESVEVDGDWVVLNLARPYPPLLSVLCYRIGSVVDEEWASEQGAWPGTEETWKDYNNPETAPLQDVANGTGPFKLDRWETGVQVVMKRNDDYWRELASLEELRFKRVEEWSTRKLEFLAGDADQIYVPRAHMKELEGIEGINIYKDLRSIQTNPAAFFTFDMETEANDWIGSGELDGKGIPSDFFGDRHVRLAFCNAFDYTTYTEDVFMGEGIKVPGPIPSSLPYFNPDQEIFSLDLEKAEEHFKKAFGGTVEDPGPVWEKGFTMTILYNTGNEQRKIAVEIWEQNIEKLNDKFTIDVRNRDWATYVNDLLTSRLPIFIIGWQADFPDPHNFVYPFMHSHGTFSLFQKYSDPHVDNLIDRGISTIDPDERREIYYELQSIYHEDAPSVPLTEPTGRRYFRDWIDGWYYNPMFPNGPYAYTITKG